MNIFGVNNFSQSFGLKKTDKYLTVENELIKNAAKLGRKEDAEIAANSIKKLLPNTILGYHQSIDRFVLKDKNNLYSIGFVNRKQPLETLTFLYKNLWKFEHGDKSEARALKIKFKHK